MPDTHPQPHRHHHSRRASSGPRAALAAGGAALLLACGCGSSQNPPANTTQSRTQASAPASAAGTPPGGGASQDPGATSTTSTSNAGGAGQSGGVSHPAVGKARVRSALASLANAKPAPKINRSGSATRVVADIELSSPAIASVRGGPSTIARRYTCDGPDSSPAFAWSGIPAGTAELALFVIDSKPVGGKLFFDWALAGINPKLHGLTAAQRPPGSVEGRDGYGHTGYQLCPPPGKRESYVFVLYALPRALTAQEGFDPATLRDDALKYARHSGLLAGSYSRG